jgi:hypothetical protein
MQNFNFFYAKNQNEIMHGYFQASVRDNFNILISYYYQNALFLRGQK